MLGGAGNASPGPAVCFDQISGDAHSLAQGPLDLSSILEFLQFFSLLEFSIKTQITL